MAKSEIVIEELTGQKRKLHLFGAGLPKRGASWPGKLRLVTTFYPGNIAQGSQQVLGPVEPPSQWQGEWNTTRLARSPAVLESSAGRQEIVYADVLREVLEDIFRQGSLLNVLWLVDPERDDGSRARQIVRTGRASDWDFAYDRIDDIVWKVSFEWTGRGAAQDKVALRSDGASTQSLQALDLCLIAVDEAVNNTKIQSLKRAIPNSANQLSLEQLGQMLDAPTKLMKSFSQSCNAISNRLRKIGDLIGKARNIPYTLLTQQADIALTAVQTASSFYDNCTRTPPDSYDLQQSLSSTVRAASYFKGGLDAANTMTKQSSDMFWAVQRALAKRAGTGEDGKGEAAASTGQFRTVVHLVHAGDTLISISRKYYGTPDGVVDIATANGLPIKTTEPTVGRVLIIPTYRGLGSGPSAFLPGIQPASSQNDPLPNGVGSRLPYAP